MVLEKAYPNTDWDTVVAYEDVRRTKPYGHGIHEAMRQLGIRDPAAVVMVGDNDADVCAAYHAGSAVVVDTSEWPRSKAKDHWDALQHVPDAFISRPRDLLNVLASPDSHLPELERLLIGAPAGPGVRFDEIGHFKPWEFGGPRRPTWISVCGRSFSNYASVERRRVGHALSASIEENKSSTEFPQAWVDAVLAFVSRQLALPLLVGRVVITVVPHRPGREPRLENFLAQLAEAASGVRRFARVSVEPRLLSFREGVLSQHNNHLGKLERFTNVRDHLFVTRPKLVSARTHYLVIDDVTTTGASLIYANEYLRDAGALNVTCLSISKNVGELFWSERRV